MLNVVKKSTKDSKKFGIGLAIKIVLVIMVLLVVLVKFGVIHLSI